MTPPINELPRTIACYMLRCNARNNVNYNALVFHKNDQRLSKRLTNN